MNPVHEQRVAEIVREEFPEAFLSVSSEVVPQYREYERFSTVGPERVRGPKVASYVRGSGAAQRARRAHGPPPDDIGVGRRHGRGRDPRPVNLLMSGPVAGVVGGIWAGKQAGYDNVITLDVGGTSADIGLAQDGRLRMKHLLDTKVGPYQAMIPMVDVDTIGAGGGSIAYVDRAGSTAWGRARPAPCRVRRPTAAGARRRPRPTRWSTSAGCSRRRSSAAACQLDADLAREAFEDGPASALGMTVEEASMGAVQILTHSMVQSIEENSVRKGYDPRDFALVAEGGAGPLFAAQIALEVGTPYGVVPPYPGVTAAMGLLATDMVYEYARRRTSGCPSSTRPALQRGSRSSRRRPREQLAEDGMPAERLQIQRVAECRYLGQGYELRVDTPSGVIDDAWVEKVRADFHDIHEREYRAASRSRTSRSRTSASAGSGSARVRTPEIEQGADSPDAALRHEGSAWFRVGGGLQQVPTRYYERAALKAGTGSSGRRSSRSTTRQRCSRPASQRTSTASGTS